MQRILIVENKLLLGAGMQGLLSNQVDLEVVGISPSDQAELVQEIERLRPNIVILGEASKLAGPTQLLAFLKEFPRLRVVVVSEDDDLVRIYDKQQARVRRAVDLISIVRSS